MATKILAVLAGGTPSFQSLGELSRGSDFVYAADSGQEICLVNGFKPDVVVGDLDSVGDRIDGVEYRQRLDQDFSDCDKLLAEIILLGEVSLVMGGLEGDRFDHVLSSLGSIVRSGQNPQILLQQGLGRIVRANNTSRVVGWRGRDFSVIGLGEAIVSTRGAQWEMDHKAISYSEGFSLSNAVDSEELEIVVHDGVALVIVDSAIVSWD